MTPRALVVGMGNVLRGDDGFGVEVTRRLQELPDVARRAKVIEVGIGGIHLVQELMDGYDLLVIADAVNRGGQPGKLYVLDPATMAATSSSLSSPPRSARSLVSVPCSCSCLSSRCSPSSRSCRSPPRQSIIGGHAVRRRVERRKKAQHYVDMVGLRGFE